MIHLYEKTEGQLVHKKPLKLAGRRQGILYQHRIKVKKINQHSFYLKVNKLFPKTSKVVLCPLPSTVSEQLFFELDELYGYSYHGNIYLMLVFYFLDKGSQNKNISSSRGDMHFSNLKIEGKFIDDRWEGSLNYIDPSPVYYQTFDQEVAAFYQKVLSKRIKKSNKNYFLSGFPNFRNISNKKILSKSKSYK